MYIENPGPKFERLQDETPHWLLDTHPDGNFVAMQIIHRQYNERAAVWDTETGKIVWEPQNANALCWINNGQTVLAVLEDYDAEEYLQVIPDGETLPPLSDGHPLALGRFLWPDSLLYNDAPVKIPAGWVYHLVASPTENRACVVWRDQTEAGIEWVAWDADHIRQEASKGYFGKELNGLHAPVFSPDGKYVVLVYGATYQWFDEDGGDDRPASPGGEFRCGKVVVCDSQTGAARESEIFVELPEGFAPDPDEDGFPFTQPPVFTTNETFTVALGNGETRVFAVK